MPQLSRRYIQMAFFNLIWGLTFGALLLYHKGVPLTPLLWRLLPLHIELMLVGWLLQFIMGIGFWIFPRFWRSRGNDTPVRRAFWLLNIGVWLAGLSGVFALPAAIFLAGRIFELASSTLFVLYAWRRIKPPGTGEWGKKRGERATSGS